MRRNVEVFTQMNTPELKEVMHRMYCRRPLHKTWIMGKDKLIKVM